MLRWWGGEEGGGSRKTAPYIEGLTSRMPLDNKAKKRWTEAVLAQAGNALTGDDVSWDRLSRTMAPAARALLCELGAQADG